jgi:hypothetical protein
VLLSGVAIAAEKANLSRQALRRNREGNGPFCRESLPYPNLPRDRDRLTPVRCVTGEYPLRISEIRDDDEGLTSNGKCNG